jgi:7-cyano-7-deazaguanine reductase
MGTKHGINFVKLPFHGSDIWNAWELTWLGPAGKPVIATAVISVQATSPNIVESKSLKLYLNSLALMRYASATEVGKIIKTDLSTLTESDVDVELHTSAYTTIATFPGTCVDDLAVECSATEVNADMLQTENENIEEELHSHLFRSNCPVTNQPDIGSLLLHYVGPKIDRESLLQYIVSYRQHNDFHEACVERMFMDIRARCRPVKLTVYARFNRRGGLDINPFRSNFEDTAQNLRLWRQ